MRARKRIHELAYDPNTVRRPSDAAFQYVTHAEVATDLTDVGGLAFVRKTGIACDHEKGLETRERGDDVLDYPVRKIFLLGIAAHVLEWQYGDGRLVRQRERLGRLGRGSRRSCRAGGVSKFDALGSHWLGDVFQRLRPHVLKSRIDLAADLALRFIGDADAAGLRDDFETRGDIHAIAKDIVVIDDDVADVNADTEFDPLILRHGGVLPSHGALEVNRAAHCIDGAGKLHQHTVTSRLDNAASMAAISQHSSSRNCLCGTSGGSSGLYDSRAILLRCSIMIALG